MGYVKKIVCLANSRKHSELCFAGKEVLDQGYGDWIRPVSARKSEGVSVEEQTLDAGGCPQLLDVVEVPILENKPDGFQQENHLIDTRQSWKKVGHVGPDQLPMLTDYVPNSLWVNDGKKNDRIPAALARQLTYSLLLIKPESLIVVVDWNPNRKGKQTRAQFRFNNEHYDLVVTDTVAESKYENMSTKDFYEKNLEMPREYEVVDETYLCVSIADMGGTVYKLVAAIIGDTD
ncbi:MAG: hypothetical protein OXU88_09280 [Gammaproteobacteria bacterium]|nr:hypothetical protein [Gammaproteobacteria bacterium]